MEASLQECLEEQEKEQEGKERMKEAGGVEVQELSTVLANENHLEDPDHTIFHNVAYLGAVVVHNPKDESAIQQHMAVMNQVRQTLALTSCSPGVLLPPGSHSVSTSLLHGLGGPQVSTWRWRGGPGAGAGTLILREGATRTRVASFKIQRIIFFARGQVCSSCSR